MHLHRQTEQETVYPRQVLLKTRLPGPNRESFFSSPARRTATDATLFEATRLHNGRLKRLIADLEKQHPDIQIATFQAFDINKATYESPEAYHFTVLDKPCFEGSLTGEFYGEKTFCNDLLGYKFWEYLHPITMMHCYYASQFLVDAAHERFVGSVEKDRLLDRCRALNPRA